MIKFSNLFLTFFILIFFNSDKKSIAVEDIDLKSDKNSSLMLMDFLSLRDTLYTFEPFFIEVNLDSQKGYLHSKEGWTKEFGVSSGNKKLYKAVETKEGLYVIQNKMLKWH